MNQANRFAFLLSVVLLVLSCSRNASAHAFGVTGVDYYVRLTPQRESLMVEFDVHLGEIPTAALSVRLDTNLDANLSRKEIMKYVSKATPVYARRLNVFVSRENRAEQLEMAVPGNGLENNCLTHIAKGENGEKTLRIRWFFQSSWPKWIQENKGNPFELKVEITNRRANHFIQFASGKPREPVNILEADIPTDRELPLPPDKTEPRTDASDIRIVKEANLVLCLENNPRVRTITAPGPQPDNKTGPVKSDGYGKMVRESESRLRGRIERLFKPPVSVYAFTAAVVLCLVWGALHAFAPGHGKAIVSAYLVGMHASYRHAVILGIIVTLTHTAIVMVLAVAALILKDRFVYPTWLEPVGAVMIVLVGANQLRVGMMKFLKSDLQDHHHHHHDDPDHDHHHHHHDDPDHDHDHHHHDDHDHHHHEHEQKITHTHWGFWKHSHIPRREKDLTSPRDLAVVGATGGMVPCPAAIVMLLLAWQMKAPGLGLACLVAFSIGLAATLTMVGFLAVSGTRSVLRWLSREETEDSHRQKLTAIMPLIGGVVLIICGMIILFTL